MRYLDMFMFSLWYSPRVSAVDIFVFTFFDLIFTARCLFYGTSTVALFPNVSNKADLSFD